VSRQNVIAGEEPSAVFDFRELTPLIIPFVGHILRPQSQRHYFLPPSMSKPLREQITHSWRKAETKGRFSESQGKAKAARVPLGKPQELAAFPRKAPALPGPPKMVQGLLGSPSMTR
jgi:hypothetical protein